jgi:hypothetical protein
MTEYEKYFVKNDEMENFRARVSNPNNKIIVWGTARLGVYLLRLLEFFRNNVEVWDTFKGGQGERILGLEVKKPELTKNAANCKNTIIVILAMGKKNRAECFELLHKAGYSDIENGWDAVSKLTTLKLQSDYSEYSKLNTDDRFIINDESLYVFSGDCFSDAGVNMADDYLVQDLWCAQKVFAAKPDVHYDIGSRVDGFITHLLSFGMKTVLIDIRKLETFGTENLTFIKEDATLLSGLEAGSIASLSSLCSLEHFGLGRYGDPVDPGAYIKAFKSIQRVMKKSGDLYISVPVSNSCRLRFNAHRVYTPEFIINQFEDMKLIEFSCTSPNGLIRNASSDDMDGTEKYGLFHFEK